MLLTLMPVKLPVFVLSFCARNEEIQNSQSPTKPILIRNFRFQPFFINNANGRVTKKKEHPFPFPFSVTQTQCHSDTPSEQRIEQEEVKERKTEQGSRTGSANRGFPTKVCTCEE